MKTAKLEAHACSILRVAANVLTSSALGRTLILAWVALASAAWVLLAYALQIDVIRALDTYASLWLAIAAELSACTLVFLLVSNALWSRVAAVLYGFVRVPLLLALSPAPFYWLLVFGIFTDLVLGAVFLCGLVCAYLFDAIKSDCKSLTENA